MFLQIAWRICKYCILINGKVNQIRRCFGTYFVSILQPALLSWSSMRLLYHVVKNVSDLICDLISCDLYKCSGEQELWFTLQIFQLCSLGFYSTHTGVHACVHSHAHNYRYWYFVYQEKAGNLPLVSVFNLGCWQTGLSTRLVLLQSCGKHGTLVILGSRIPFFHKLSTVSLQG